MFKIYTEPESPNEGVFEIHDETESPNERACLRYMMHRNRHRKSHAQVGSPLRRKVGEISRVPRPVARRPVVQNRQQNRFPEESKNIDLSLRLLGCGWFHVS